MITVSDASPLIYLGKLEHFELLPRLYNVIQIPLQVERELICGIPRETALTYRGSWLKVVTVVSLDPKGNLLRNYAGLHAGEAEAIQLALQSEASLLLIDDSTGARAALECGVKTTGVIGVLLSAKKAGLIKAIAPLLLHLTSRTSFRASHALVKRALTMAGEEA